MSCNANMKTTMVAVTYRSAGNEITLIHSLELTKPDCY